MNDSNIAAAVIETLKDSGYTLLQNKVDILVPAYEGEVGRRLATLLGKDISSGDFKHVELTVNDTKAQVSEKIKKALKK